MAWNPFRGRAATSPDDAASEVARLLRSALAEAGVETVPEDGALRGADGQQYGLAGITHLAASSPRRQWPGLVREHVRRLLLVQARPEPQSLEDVADVLHLRVMHHRDVPGATGAVRPLVGDLGVLAVVDLPEAVQMLNDPEILDRLGGWDVVREVGLANLRRLQADDTFTLQDGTVHVSVGGFLNASRLLTMETLLAQDFGLERPSHGVLVAVPNRHAIAVHPLRGPEVVDALSVLVNIARGESDQPGGISDQVYLWRDGVLEQVTRTAPDGGVAVHVDGELHRVMLELGLLAEG